MIGRKHKLSFDPALLDLKKIPPPDDEGMIEKYNCFCVLFLAEKILSFFFSPIGSQCRFWFVKFELFQ